uniref:Uncharacterized protein n=1 Tax=Rhizophora mucronata TaxID=61149 RepID=A0A2P2ING7_RHIMU
MPFTITNNSNNDIHINLVFGLPSSSPSVVLEDHNHTPSPCTFLCHSNPNNSVMEIDANSEKKTTKKKRKNKKNEQENGIDLDVKISRPGVNQGLTCSLSKDQEDALSVSDGNMGSSGFVADLNSVGKKETIRDVTSLNTEGSLIGTKRLDEVLSQFVYKGGDMMMKNSVQRHMSYSPYFAKVAKNEQRNEEKDDNKIVRMESQATCNKVDNEVVCSSTIQQNLHGRKARRTEKQEPQNGTSCMKVHKVSTHFYSTIEQQIPLKERLVQGIKMKALRKCEKPCSTVRKVSPYFQKESMEEEIADNGSAECKSGHKKLPMLSTVLSKSQKLNEAYRRKTPDNTWKPPQSERGLLQEDHADDPWRVLVICMLLNRTTGLQVCFCGFFLGLSIIVHMAMNFCFLVG